MTETLRDGQGHPVDGMVFNLIFSPLAREVRRFRAVQHRDGSITVQVVALEGLSDAARAHIERCTRERLPGVAVAVEEVASIPLTAAGKRQPVVVER